MLVAKQPDVKGIFQVFEFKWKDSLDAYNRSGVFIDTNYVVLALILPHVM